MNPFCVHVLLNSCGLYHAKTRLHDSPWLLLAEAFTQEYTKERFRIVCTVISAREIQKNKGAENSCKLIINVFLLTYSTSGFLASEWFCLKFYCLYSYWTIFVLWGRGNFKRHSLKTPFIFFSFTFFSHWRDIFPILSKLYSPSSEEKSNEIWLFPRRHIMKSEPSWQPTLDDAHARAYEYPRC